MFIPSRLHLRRCFGFLLVITILVTCFDMRNRFPGYRVLQLGEVTRAQAGTNSIDNTDFFVRQNYRDFLNREPDAAGLQFWTNEIESCGANAQCREVKRINVSAAFFLSIEFQQTGFLVYRAYAAAFGLARVGGVTPLAQREFLPDMRRIGQGLIVNSPGWEQVLETNKQNFFNEFVARPQFLAAYPAAMTPTAFVTTLNQNAGGALSAAERDALIADLSANNKTRAQVLRAVAEDADLHRNELNRAFVLMQYFGYLRRNPNDAPEANLDFAGYNFWLGKLNQFNGNFIAAEMVKAFISSNEYRARFISGEQALSSVNKNISSGFEQVQLPGVMVVDFSDNVARPPMSLTLSYVSAPEAADSFRADMQVRGLPPVTMNSMLKVSASQAVPGFMGAHVRVPDEVLANLTPELEPQLYALVADRTDSEESGDYVILDSTYDASTRTLNAPLPGRYLFADDSTSAANAGVEYAAAAEQSITIMVSVEKIGTRKVPVTGSLSSPNSNQVEARVRDTIHINGTFNVNVPVGLLNPMGSGLPTLNSPYAADHHGLDIRASDGDPVRAAAKGEVVGTGYQELKGQHPRCNPSVTRGGGRFVRIKHEDGSVSSYAHLLEGSTTVQTGDQVAAGQQLAQADHTGGVCPAPGGTGAHLHFGYKVDDQFVNPESFFTTDPQAFEKKWLDKLSFVTSVNGTIVEETRRQVTQRNFTYDAPLDLSALPFIESGHTYPLVVSVQTDDKTSMRVYSGQLKILSTSLRAVLTWNKDDTDVDLHVRDSKGQESWYQNLCGIPNGCLDHDDTDGFGPETFSLPQFESGVTYMVFLHYYDDHGQGPTTATVKVYVDDKLETEKTVTLSNGQFADIGTYSQPPPNLRGPLRDAEAVRSTAVPLSVVFRPTTDPDVLEYSLPGLPTLRLVRKK